MCYLFKVWAILTTHNLFFCFLLLLCSCKWQSNYCFFSRKSLIFFSVYSKLIFVHVCVYQEFMDLKFYAHTTQKIKFSIKDFFSKCDQMRRKLWIWSHFLKGETQCQSCSRILRTMFYNFQSESRNVSPFWHWYDFLYLRPFVKDLLMVTGQIYVLMGSYL